MLNILSFALSSLLLSAPATQQSRCTAELAPARASIGLPAVAPGTSGVGDTFCDDWAETEDVIYWTAYTEHAIKAATTTGDQVRDVIVVPGASPFAIEVDAVGRKIYWTENGFGGGNSRKIRRADLSGANIEDLVVDGILQFPAGIALDLRAGKIYWGDRDAAHIGRANLDGSDVEILVSNCNALGVELDLSSGKIYWAEEGDEVRRANLDGSMVETVVALKASPNDVAIDSVRRKIYWTVDYQHVKRANLDGTNIENVNAGTGNPFGIAVDPIGGKVYWANYFVDLVSRANLDGSGYEELTTGSGSEGFGLAFAPAVAPPGHIVALGSTSVADNDLTLMASGVPASTAGLFFYGSREVFLPLGHGFRCVGGPLQRLTGPQLTDTAGVASHQVDLSGGPAFGDIATQAPITMSFQFWYRERGSNRLTDATRVDFVP